MTLFKNIENKILDFTERESRKLYEASFLMAIPLEFQELKDIIECIPLRDDIRIDMSAENDNHFFFHRDITEMEYNNSISELLEDGNIIVKFEIDKRISNSHFSVYCFEEFSKDLLQLTIEDVLKVFSMFIKESGSYIVFDLFDNKNIVCTKSMYFMCPDNQKINEEFNREQRLQDCREISYFYNQDIYELLPDDFKIIVDYEGNPLSELFHKLEAVLALCMLASNSLIQKENLKLQIMGQRSVEYTYALDKIGKNQFLYKIYDWIYSGGSSVDKAIIARNIICLHCKYEPLIQLDAKVMAAILSNYNLYLKENVTQYLELKNKVAEFISGTLSKTGEYATELLDKFKANLIAIFAFLFTVIISNIVANQPLDHIFTRDITAILELVLAGSAVYLFISYKQSNYQMEKVYKSYYELKKSYNEILTEDDIKECFQDDRIIDNMKKDIKKSQIIYLVIWVAFLVMLFLFLETMTDNSALSLLLDKMKLQDYQVKCINWINQ